MSSSPGGGGGVGSSSSSGGGPKRQQQQQQQKSGILKSLTKLSKPSISLISSLKKCNISKFSLMKSLLSCRSVDEKPERIISTGLLVWSQKFSDLSGLKMVDNYLVRYDPESEIILNDEQVLPADFCDFIFPILIGWPNDIPLNQQWVKKINTLMNPGCYLVCARPKSPNFWLPTEQTVKVGLYKTNLETKLTRLDANLLFVMHSVCKTDVNLNVTEYVDFIDDLDSVRDHFFPHRLSQNMAQVMTRRSLGGNNLAVRARTHLQKVVDNLSREPSEESLNLVNTKNPEGELKRILKRYDNLVQIYSEVLLPELYKVKETFVTKKSNDDRNFYSERFNFFLSKDSYAVILDQNSVFDRLQWKIVRDTEDKPGPFVRLIRSGAYVAIEGTPRYCNLKNPNHSFYTRSMFLCRLTSFPMIIIQEGIKCFDAYYNNDGLDFTYFDSIPINDLIYVDWYQIQIDLKMDQNPRIFKGHLMFWDEMNDILPTLPFSQLEFDPSMASRITMLYMEQEESRPFRPLIIFTLQQVFYTYFDALQSRLEILWNLYFRVDDTHLGKIECGKKLEIVPNPVYFYMKSFNCSYLWTQKDSDHPIKEERKCDVIASSVDVTDIDLAKIGWSHQMFEEYLTLYLGRLYPYQNSIKQWLVDETRKIKRQLIIRPTTLTDKLLYRNEFYQIKMEQFQKEQAQKPKLFLNMKQKSNK